MGKTKFTKEEKERLSLAFDMIKDFYKPKKYKSDDDMFVAELERQAVVDNEIGSIRDLLSKLSDYFND